MVWNDIEKLKKVKSAKFASPEDTDHLPIRACRDSQRRVESWGCVGCSSEDKNNTADWVGLDKDWALFDNRHRVCDLEALTAKQRNLVNRCVEQVTRLQVAAIVDDMTTPSERWRSPVSFEIRANSWEDFVNGKFK